MTDVFDQRLALPEEIPLLAKLRSELGADLLENAPPEAKSDIGLLRFLRGYANDVPAAANAFQQGMTWRGINNTARWRPMLLMKADPEKCSFEEIVTHYTDLSRLPHWNRVGMVYPERFFHGHDKTGNPIMITSHDMIEHVFALMSVCSRTEYDEFRVARSVNLELYLDALSRHFKKLIKCVYIWDLNGMTRSLWKNWENKCVKAYWGDYDHASAIAFPEQAYRVVAVNVPSWLMVVWRVVKSVIPGRTLKKVTVVGTSGVANTLLKQCEIPVSSLPKHLNGTCTINYFVRPRDISELKMEAIEIAAGSSRAVEIDCSADAKVCLGVFVHGGKEIALRYEIREGGQKQSFTSKNIRVEEFYREEVNSADRASSGLTVKLQFDNRSSMFFSKTVEYIVAPFSEVYHEARSSINKNE